MRDRRRETRDGRQGTGRRETQEGVRRETGGKLETGFRRQKKGDRRGFYDVKAGVNK